MEVMSCLQMGTNAYYYLYPIGSHPELNRLWIVRPAKTLKGDIPHGHFVLVPTRFRLLRFVIMLWHCIRLGRRDDVEACISFNPVPYGIILLLSAFFHRKPVHLGFVGGLDWDYHSKGPFGRWLRPFFRRADFFTATGTRMRQEMIEYGFPAERIAILPHGIDVEQYPIADPEQAGYSCIYVGQLIRRKRVDVILRAFAEVLRSHPEARLCIVGDGPKAGQLKKLAADLAISDKVDFVGFQERVQPYLSNSRMLLMSSAIEGLPFAIIEAMCSGVVPVSTLVGTIEDLVVDGENGLLFERGAWQALANHVCRLLEDKEMYRRLRSEALLARDIYSFEVATQVWDDWFRQLDDRSRTQQDRRCGHVERPRA